MNLRKSTRRIANLLMFHSVSVGFGAEEGT